MTDPDTQALITVERRLRDPEFCERLRTLLNRSGFVHVPAAELRAYLGDVAAYDRLTKASDTTDSRAPRSQWHPPAPPPARQRWRVFCGRWDWRTQASARRVVT